MESAAFDFLTHCAPGTMLETRDRRAARIISVDRAAGILRGEVRMAGVCQWRADGRYAEAPAGAAGPLDLVPPLASDDRRVDLRPRGSLAEALRNPESNPGCCD